MLCPSMLPRLVWFTQVESCERIPATKLEQGALGPAPGTCSHPHAWSVSLLPGTRSDFKMTSQ